ncbi:hypothetical protein VPHD51_0175 [Vibrio phage D51]
MTDTMITVPKAELATLKAIVTAKHKWLSEEYKHVYNLLGIMDERLQLVHDNIKEYIRDPVRFQHRMETKTIAAKTIERKGFMGLFGKSKHIPEQKKVTYTIATPGDVRRDVKSHVLRTMALAGYPGIAKRVTVEETHWSRMCPPCLTRGFVRDYITASAPNGTCRITVEVRLSDEHRMLRTRVDETLKEKGELDSILADLELAAQCDRDIYMPLEKYVKAKAVKCEK